MDIASFAPKVSSADARDARPSWVRLHTAIPTLCRPIDPEVEPFWPGKIRDLSPQGIALVVPFHSPPGSRVHVYLDVGPHGTPCLWDLGVRHARRHSNDASWVLSCEFSQPLSEQELKALLARYPAAF